MFLINAHQYKFQANLLVRRFLDRSVSLYLSLCLPRGGERLLFLFRLLSLLLLLWSRTPLGNTKPIR